MKTIFKMDAKLLSRIIGYYKDERVARAIVEHGFHREIGLRKRDGSFAKRPQILQYPSDVISHVQRGVTSFHASEELWSNPLFLGDRDPKDLRIGWDLVLDIDCKEYEYSRIAAMEVLKVLKKYGVKNYWIKFSGNKGFHIALAYESFPERFMGLETRNLFPEAPRKIAAFISTEIKGIGKKILRYEKNNLDVIAQKTGIDKKELFRSTSFEGVNGNIEIKEIDMDNFVGKILSIDTILISPRHLYRMPYSLHEKSWLVSIPLRERDLKTFRKEDATIEKVLEQWNGLRFIDRSIVEKGEAELLLRKAYEEVKEESDRGEMNKKRAPIRKVVISNKVDEKDFPPCIKKGLEGLPDGRKRFLFILINFLRYMNWSKEEIIERIKEWNRHNIEPLRESYVNSQIKYAFRHKARLPPNCDKREYYKDIGICFNCGLKNPVNYITKKRKKEGEGAS